MHINTKLLKKYFYHHSFLSVFLLYSYFSSNIYALFLIVFIAFLSFLIAFKKSNIIIKYKWEKIFFTCTILLAIILLFGQIYWNSNIHAITMIIPIFIFFLLKSSDINIFKKALLFWLTLVVAIATYEKLFNTYFFISEYELGDSLIFLDARLFSGQTQMLRAKSIFLGPLTLSTFLIFSSIILRHNNYALLISLLGAVLSTSRTALIIVSIIILTVTIKNKSLLWIYSIFILFFLLFAFFFPFSLSDSPYLTRLFNVFDFSNYSGSNYFRLQFWKNGLDLFLSYSTAQILIGDQGLFRELYLNNAESGWLTMILDFGILGFSFLIFPLFYSFFALKNVEAKIILSVIFIANSVFTFSYGVVGAFCYWTLIYYIYIENFESDNRGVNRHAIRSIREHKGTSMIRKSRGKTEFPCTPQHRPGAVTECAILPTS